MLLTIRSNERVRCGEVIALVQRVTPLSLLVNLNTVLSSFGMEERGIMGGGKSLEVVPERRAHLVENLSERVNNGNVIDGVDKFNQTHIGSTGPHGVTTGFG